MNARTRIKICGVTRVQDALAAARHGADAIGLVFHAPAARNVTIERAAEVLAVLPAFVTPVALFVDAPVEQVREVTGRLGIRHVQLHGHEPPEVVAALPELRVIKALRVNETLPQALAPWHDPSQRALPMLCGLVLETGGTAAPGGTGVENDWSAIRRHLDSGLFAGLPPLVAAGGLTPLNVEGVVRLLRPWAVDVSSGVEERKGIKSEEKIEAFCGNVRAADVALAAPITRTRSRAE